MQVTIVDLGDEIYSGVCSLAVPNLGAVCSGEEPDSSMLSISSGESRRLYINQYFTQVLKVPIYCLFSHRLGPGNVKWPWFDKSNVIMPFHEP